MSTREQSQGPSSKPQKPRAFPFEEAVVFGSNVERLRTAEGLSITKFCAMAGISRPTLYKIERGEGDPRLSMMRKIAKALGVEVGDLLTTRGWDS